jgi:flagellar assembly protein FliH
MPLCKILPKEQSLDVCVLEYDPQNIVLDIPDSKEKMEEDSATAKFKLDELLAEQTGLASKERAAIEKAIEEGVLRRLQEVQEKAYEEAHSLGMEEGRTEGEKKFAEEVNNQLKKLSEMLRSLESLKKDLITQNESLIVELAFHLGRTIAMDHIETNPDRILPVLSKIMDALQADDEVRIRLAEEDVKDIEKLQAYMHEEFENLQKVKFVGDPNMAVGGCIVESAFGQIDASIEERVQRLWQTMKETRPKIEDKLEE